MKTTSHQCRCNLRFCVLCTVHFSCVNDRRLSLEVNPRHWPFGSSRDSEEGTKHSGSCECVADTAMRIDTSYSIQTGGTRLFSRRLWITRNQGQKTLISIDLNAARRAGNIFVCCAKCKYHWKLRISALCIAYLCVALVDLTKRSRVSFSLNQKHVVCLRMPQCQYKIFPRQSPFLSSRNHVTTVNKHTDGSVKSSRPAFVVYPAQNDTCVRGITRYVRAYQRERVHYLRLKRFPRLRTRNVHIDTTHNYI